MYFRLAKDIDSNFVLKRSCHVIRVMEIHLISVLGDAKAIAVLGVLYTITGEVDEGINRTELPLIAYSGLKILLPKSMLAEEVNIIPLELDIFVSRQPNAVKLIRATFSDWENSWYRGRLAFYNV